MPLGTGVSLLRLSKNRKGIGLRKVFSAGLGSPGSTAGRDARRYGAVLRSILAEIILCGYTAYVNFLTKHDQWVLVAVVVLLVTGGLTKMYRAAHPALKPGQGTSPTTAVIQQARP